MAMTFLSKSLLVARTQGKARRNVVIRTLASSSKRGARDEFDLDDLADLHNLGPVSSSYSSAYSSSFSSSSSSSSYSSCSSSSPSPSSSSSSPTSSARTTKPKASEAAMATGPGGHDALAISKALNALARRKSDNEGAWRAHLRRAEVIAPKACAESTARVLHACARSPIEEEADEVAALYVRRASSLVPKCSARHLSMIVNALARMDLRDVELLGKISRELRTKFGKCRGYDASNIVNGYARLAVAERILFGQLTPSYIAAHGHKFQVKDLALVLNAYAKVELRNKAVFRALSERCREQAPRMDGQAISVIANAHARLLIVDEPLFKQLAWQLRLCSRTCTLQAVSNLIHAYAKFGFTDELLPEAGWKGGHTVSITDGVFDCLLGELPRLRSQMTAQSLCVITHAAARANQHKRQPELPGMLADLALSVGLSGFAGSQLSMLSVAFAELSPLLLAKQSEDGEANSVVRLWEALADETARRNEELNATDAANCAVAFAASHCPSSTLKNLRLLQHCEEEPAPAVAAAFAVALAFSEHRDQEVLEPLEAYVPGFLWQATDIIACQLSLALWLCRGHVPTELRKAVYGHVLRSGALAERTEVGGPEDAGLRASCQGFVAAAMPGMRTLLRESHSPVGSGRGQEMWLEISIGKSRKSSTATAKLRPRHAEGTRVIPKELGVAGKRLAGWLSAEQPTLADILQTIAETRRKGVKPIHQRIPNERSSSSTPSSEATSSSSSSSFSSSTTAASTTTTAAAASAAIDQHRMQGQEPQQQQQQLMQRRSLSSLLLPSAWPMKREESTEEAIRRLHRGFRRLGLEASLPPPEASLVGTADLTLYEDDLPLPVAILVDDEPKEKWDLALTPEAALRGILLASDGYLVVRVRSQDVASLLRCQWSDLESPGSDLEDEDLDGLSGLLELLKQHCESALDDTDDDDERDSNDDDEKIVKKEKTEDGKGREKREANTQQN